MHRRQLMSLTFLPAALLCLPTAFAVGPAAIDEAAVVEAAADRAVAPQASEAAPRDLSRYKEEKVPGGTLMLIAYMVMWGLVAAMVGRTLMRQAKLEAELTELSERVDVLAQDDGVAS